MLRACCALLGLLLIGCGEDITVDEACRDFCRCSQPLPSLQRECQRSCEEDLAEAQPSPGCLQCVATVACDGPGASCSAQCSDDQE